MVFVKLDYLKDSKVCYNCILLVPNVIIKLLLNYIYHNINHKMYIKYLQKHSEIVQKGHLKYNKIYNIS